MLRDLARTAQRTPSDSVKKNQQVNALQGNNPCLFQEPNKTHKCILLCVTITEYYKRLYLVYVVSNKYCPHLYEIRFY
jgi:hypothetical protein